MVSSFKHAGMIDRSIAVLRSGPVLLSLAGMCSALVGWMIFEPFFQEGGAVGRFGPANALMFPTVIGLICAILGSVESMRLRRGRRTFATAIAAFGIAFSITSVLLIPARLIFLWFEAATTSTQCASGVRDLLPVLIGRSLSWGLLGCGAGLALACANPRGKTSSIRIAGGLTAGLIAGILYDPIEALAAGVFGDAAWISRCSAFAFIGGLLGFLTGVAGEFNAVGSVLVISGDSYGDRTLIGSQPAYIGSSPNNDVVIENSISVLPRHAVVQKNGLGFEIQSLCHEEESSVNGEEIGRIGLKHGDRIRIGDTNLLFTRPYD